MKKFRKLFLVLFVVFFSSFIDVNAASKCDYNKQAELNNLAANIKISYEEAEAKVSEENLLPNDSGEVGDATYEYFKITIYNMAEDFYLKITNDYNSEVKYLNYQNTESGVATFDWNNLDKITNFKIEVYSSNATGCPNEEYRIIYLTTPRLNDYSGLSKCYGNEDFYLCQKYTLEEEISLEEFDKALDQYQSKKEVIEEKKENQDNGLFDKINDFIENNKAIVIVISTIIVIAGVVTTVIVIKKRRSRLI